MYVLFNHCIVSFEEYGFFNVQLHIFFVNFSAFFLVSCKCRIETVSANEVLFGQAVVDLRI